MFLWHPAKAVGDFNLAIEAQTFKEVQRAGLNLIKEVVTARKERKRKDPYCVPVVLRTSPPNKLEMRFLNFHIDFIDGQRFSELNYPGALGQAEEVLKGKWRLASDSEEDAEYVRQAQAKVDAAVATVQIHETLNRTSAATSEAYRKAAEIIHNAQKKLPEEPEKKLEPETKKQGK